MNLPFVHSEVKPFWRRSRKGRFFTVNRFTRRKKKKNKPLAKGWTGTITPQGFFSVRKKYTTLYKLNPFKNTKKKLDREYNIQKKLGRLNIAPKVRKKGDDFFDMQFLKGKTLQDIDLSTARKRRRYAKASAQKIKKMHDKGVQHNDLHRGNIFVTRGLIGEKVRIIDYGSAKDKNRPLTIKERRKDTGRLLWGVNRKLKGKDYEDFQDEFNKEYLK